MNRLFKVITFGVFIISATAFNAAENNSHHSEEQDTTQKDEAWDPVPVVMDHIKDAHDWHFFDYKDEHGHAHPVSLSLPVILYTDGNFDVVVANIAANVLITLAETLVATVAENGIIITSGVLKTRINDVISAFEFAGGEVRSTRQIEDWTTTLIARAR